MTDAPRIKICGLKDADTIAAMEGLPIHEIGFIFAPSKRQVEPQLAAQLIEAVKKLRTAGGLMPQTVGVFVNSDLEQLREIVAVAPLDVIQLHGQESPELAHSIKQELQVKVWKVFSIGGPTNNGITAAERLAPYEGAVDAVLIDTAGGGTGQTFDWHVIAQYKDAANAIGAQLYVAGGLHEGNVSELLTGYTPDGIDVSSGVETDGRKDISKIRQFVGKVLA